MGLCQMSKWTLKRFWFCSGQVIDEELSSGVENGDGQS